MLLKLALKSRFSGLNLLGAGIMNVRLCDESKRMHGRACELDLKKKENAILGAPERWLCN